MKKNNKKILNFMIKNKEIYEIFKLLSILKILMQIQVQKKIFKMMMSIMKIFLEKKLKILIDLLNRYMLDMRMELI